MTYLLIINDVELWSSTREQTVRKRHVLSQRERQFHDQQRTGNEATDWPSVNLKICPIEIYPAGNRPWLSHANQFTEELARNNV